MSIHTIYNEDCRVTMAKLSTKSVDLILTDPPYGIGLEYDSYIDSDDAWYDLIKDTLPEMQRVARMVIMPSCQIKRLKWIYDNFPPDWLICWYKGSPGHASFIGFNDWEPHLVYGRTKNQLYMHDYFQTRSSPKKGTYNHPCPKPEEWAEWIINRATEEDDLIYDPFLGSGTVAVIAERLNRKYLGSEISIDYWKDAKKRILKEIHHKYKIPFLKRDTNDQL